MKLTAQEKRAFELFAFGHNLSEISLIMGMSYQQTVNLMNNILAKSPYKTAKELYTNADSIEIED